MNNLNRPASPQPIAFSGDNSNAQTSWGVHEDFAGFTKLELASLMIAQGMLSRITKLPEEKEDYAARAVQLAKAVLEEANKETV